MFPQKRNVQKFYFLINDHRTTSLKPAAQLVLQSLPVGTGTGGADHV